MFPKTTSTSPLRSLATIDGWPINLADPVSAVGEIVRAAARRECFAVFTLNLDHLDKLRRMPRFRAAYAKARFITADGAPVAFLASRQGTRIERTTGADLILPLARACAKANVPIYVFGTTPHVLADASTKLIQYAGTTLEIAGSESPDPDFDPRSSDADAALDRIAASGARLCFVALGAPKQEFFAARAVERGIMVGFVCIGAGLDFIAGTQTRAPRIMQKLGIEWAWRLATNPRRLGLRYARCALTLANICLRAPSAADR